MTMQKECAVEMATSDLKFGVGITREVGIDYVVIGLKRGYCLRILTFIQSSVSGD